MPFSHERRLIFVHVPKTGGTSIIYGTGNSWELRGANGEFIHSTISDYRSYVADGYSTFSVVRNPCDRFLSCYRFSISDRNFWHRKGGVPHSDRVFCSIHDIDEILEALHSQVDPDTGWLRSGDLVHQSWMPQFRYVTDGGRIVVDRLLRFETLSSDYAVLAHDYGLGGNTLKHMNRSDVPQDFVTLSGKQLDMIHEIYRKDFEILGYDKNYGNTQD